MGAAGAALLGAGKLRALAPAVAKGGSAGISMSSPGIPMVDGHPVTTIKSGFCSTGNPWEELGVTPIVNIQGTVTVMGGSVMKPEVIEAIRWGNMHFCVIDELEVQSGKWLAKLVKAPEGYTALVTEGDAAGLLVSYSGMMTEDYQQRLVNIPDLRGFPKTEVIILNGHRDNFDHQIRQTGAKLVVVNDRDEMIRAINPRTVAMHWNDIQSNRNDVSAPDFISIARQHGIYALCDASADVPPKERLWEFPAMGWDIVVFSGGKDICGPQATGFLIGKENLLHYALMNMSPQENRIGRPCKVAKESLFGLMKAVEMFVEQDYSATLKKYDMRADTITRALARYGVTMTRSYNEKSLGNVSPHYTWTFDPDKIKLTGPEITQKLGETKPVAIGAPPGRGMGSGGMTGRTDPNWTGPNDYDIAPAGGARAAAGARGGRGGAPNSFGFSTWLLKDGEDRYIANRLVNIFEEAGAKPATMGAPRKAAPKKS
jgi:L-seryl-tRNA(Ser) seleniumtransferase